MRDDLESLISNGREERSLEFKRTMHWSEAKAKVVKSALAMANIRDGGAIVFGLERQQDDSYKAVGMSQDDFESFNQDHVSVEVNKYADPSVEVRLERIEIEGNRFAVILVREFHDLPIVCKRDGENLRVGAIYVRPRSKHETTELRSQNEMREILELAVEKRVRSLYAQTERLGARLVFPKADDDRAFDDQLRLPDTETEALLEIIRTAGYWRIRLRPSVFHKARLQDLDHCRSVMSESVVPVGGWEYPIFDEGRLKMRDDRIAGFANHGPFIEYWDLFQSGQFVHNLAMREDHMNHHPQFFMPQPGKKYLSIPMSIHMITDITEFAARLAYRQVLSPAGVISIELHGMAGRELAFMMPNRRLPDRFWFKDEAIHLEHTYAIDQLIAQPKEIAADLSIRLFQKAGWNPPNSLVVEEQSRYVTRRE